MAKKLISSEKLDSLANMIAAKSGEAVPMTLDEMTAAVHGIDTGGGEPNLQAKTYTVDSAGTETIMADSGYDGLSEVEVSVPQGEVYVSCGHNFFTSSGVRKWQYTPNAQVYLDDSLGAEGFIADGYNEDGEQQIFNAVPKNTTVTPTTSPQTIGGTNYMMEGAVTVAAMPSGTAGTPTATKGTVSNHSVAVTPSVTNTAGYISGGTKTGTAVSVSASELVSGTYNVDSSGTKDVTNYASASVPSGSATPPTTISGTSATVSTGTNTLTLSKTVSNTPQVSAGYVSAGTAGNTSVSLTANVTTKGATTYHPSASQQTIASGTYLTGTQTINAVTTTNLTAANIKSGVVVQVGDSSDSDCVTSVTGTYSGGSSKNVQAYFGRAQRTANSYGATALTITVAKTGTYNVYWTAWRGSSSGTMGTNLYRNGTAGTNQQTWTGTYGQNITLTNRSYTKDDVLTLYATSGSNSRSVYVANLIIEEQ